VVFLEVSQVWEACWVAVLGFCQWIFGEIGFGRLERAATRSTCSFMKQCIEDCFCSRTVGYSGCRVVGRRSTLKVALAAITSSVTW
ncbi:hypothetical protein R3P38DRAFT_2942777, partial [Favolaschia claudopus]